MRTATARIVSIFKESSIYSAGSFLNKLLLFLMVPLYSHFILPEDLSLLAVLDPAEQFLYALLHLGLSQALFKEYRQDSDAAARSPLVSTTFWFITLTSLASAGVLIAFARPVVHALVADHPLAFACYYLTIGSLVLRLYNLIGTSYLQAARRAVLISGLVLAGSAAYGAYNLVALAFMDAQIDAVFQARLLLIGVPAAAGLVLTRRFIRFTFDGALLRRMLRFSYPFVLSAAAYPILNFFDRWMLQQFVDATATGVYDLSYRFGMIPGMVLVAPFLRAWQPSIYDEGDEATRERVYQRVLLYYALAGCVLWLGLSVFSLELLQIFSEERYFGGHVIIPYVAASQFFYGLGWIVIAGLAVQEKTLFIGLCTFAAALLNIGLNFLLIPAYGMIGAALATLVAFAAIFAGFAMYSYWQLPLVWPYGRLAAMLGSSVVAFALLGQLRPGGLLVTLGVKGLLLLPVLYGLAYLAGLDVRRLRAIVGAVRSPEGEP